MTNKERELIEILLDNITPDDWPEGLPYAAQDKYDAAVYVYSGMPDISSIYKSIWSDVTLDCECIAIADVICKHWNKTIVHRDEFMKRWIERNPVVDSEGCIQWNGGEMPVEIPVFQGSGADVARGAYQICKDPIKAIEAAICALFNKECSKCAEN